MAKTNATNSTTARTSRKGAKKSASTELAVVNMSDAVTVSGAEHTDPGVSMLDSLLAELDTSTGEVVAEASGEIIENADVDLGAAAEGTEGEVIEPTAGVADEEIAAAVGHVEAVEAMVKAATPDEADPAAAPTGSESDAPAPVVEAAPKKTPTPRKHYTDKVERIKDRLGAGAAEYTVLTLTDAGVDEEQLRMRMEETFAIMKGLNKKSQNRAGFLMDFLSGKTAKLSHVLERTLQVLHRDGHISTGKAGNLLTDLIAKPYSIASARAMSGNTLAMYEALKLIKEDGKGKFVANPESTLLAAANAKLGLVPAAASEAAAA